VENPGKTSENTGKNGGALRLTSFSPKPFQKHVNNFFEVTPITIFMTFAKENL